MWKNFIEMIMILYMHTSLIFNIYIYIIYIIILVRSKFRKFNTMGPTVLSVTIYNFYYSEAAP